MTPSERQAVIQRISASLLTFDDGLLEQLDDALGGSTDADRIDDGVAPTTRLTLSRRQAIGGAAGLAVLALASARVLADACSTGAGAVDASTAARLLVLYRALAAEDLDAAARAAVDALGAPVGGVLGAAKALSGGLGAVGAGLAAAEGAMAPLRDGAARAETVLGQLEAALRQLIEAAPGAPAPIDGGFDAATANEAVAAVIGSLAERLPPGAGDEARERLEAVRRLIVLVPETLAAVQEALLGPLRAQWLPADGGADGSSGIQAQLFDPLHRSVLEPGDELVAAAGALSAAWRSGVGGPLPELLARRAELLERIAASEGRRT